MIIKNTNLRNNNNNNNYYIVIIIVYFSEINPESCQDG